MSFKEVNRLRKSGQLEEAARISQEDMAADPFDEWNKRGAIWVYYDYMKLAVADNNISDFLNQLEKIAKLKLPSNERIAFDAVAWSVGKLLFANDSIDMSVLDTIFEKIQLFNFSKKTDSYSFLLKAFKKHSNNWDSFLKFVEWWDLDNFQRKDYDSYISEAGNKLPSLVESVYISISKKLLEKPADKNKISEFLPKIEYVSKSYSNMQYPPYYYGLLLLELGDKKEFLKAFLPFVRKKQREFWVWNHLAEAFDSSSEEYYMCLCKSMSCGAPDNFTINVREKLAKEFVKRKMYSEAKYEYSKIISVRKTEGWSLKDEHSNWLKYYWWNNTDLIKDNRDIYARSNDYVGELLYADVEPYIAIVLSVNEEKKVFSFGVSERITGFSNYSYFGVKLKRGDFVEIRLQPKQDEKSNYYKLYTLSKTDKLPSKEVYKEISGTITIYKGNSFGFVDGVFVPPALIKLNNLNNNDNINGVAVYVYNPKRKDWGWVLTKLMK